MVLSLGIPYAKPPLGDLRFAKPLPFGSFKDNFHDGTEYGAICAQLSDLESKPIGNEDCLFLNIFAPNDTSVKKVRGDRCNSDFH